MLGIITPLPSRLTPPWHRLVSFDLARGAVLVIVRLRVMGSLYEPLPAVYDKRRAARAAARQFCATGMLTARQGGMMVCRKASRLICPLLLSSANVLAVLGIDQSVNNGSAVFSQPGFEVRYPGSWKTSGEDPAHTVSIRGPGGSFALLQVFNEASDPKEKVQRAVVELSKLMESSSTHPFTKWGRYEGFGQEIVGKWGKAITHARVFAHSQGSQSCLVQQVRINEDSDSVSQGMSLIEETFTLRDPLKSTGNVAAAVSGGKPMLTTDALKLAKVDYEHKEYGRAEELYRQLITQMQLLSGFSDPLMLEALDGLSAALNAQAKDEEAAATKHLAQAIMAGAIPKRSSGTIDMEGDGRIVIRKRVSGPNEFLGDCFLELKPGKPGYEETLKLVGQLKPGETKLMPFWPGRPGTKMAEVGCAIDARKEIYVFQISKYEFDNEAGLQTSELENNPERTMPHITAHALDRAMGNVSHSGEFREAYFSDAVHIPMQRRVALAFYLQPGDAGPEETFAALHQVLHDREPGECLRLVLASFPRLAQVVRAHLEKLSQPSKSAAGHN